MEWPFRFYLLKMLQVEKLFNTSCLVQNFISSYPFPKQALVFMCPQYKSFKNTVTGNFSFFHIVSYPFEKLFAFVITVKIVVCKLF